MKLLFTEGIGASQTTTNAQDEKIPVYETKTAAENDLANLEVGQIIATKDEGNELSNPVDVVEDGNMHAVTSNAVNRYLVWHYKTVSCVGGTSGSIEVPNGYNGNYEYSIFDYKYHTLFHGIHITSDGTMALGNITTNFSSLSNDSITLNNTNIVYNRESTAGDFRIAFRPIPNGIAI